MPYTNIEMTKTKERLEDLRKEKKLTFEQLANCLTNAGTSITHTSLRNYEINDPLHSLYDRTRGMSIQNLVALAEFYDVSIDYILGLSDSKKRQYYSVNKQLGLSDKAIEQIRSLNTNIVKVVNFKDIIPSVIFNRILETKQFELFIESIYKAIDGYVDNNTLDDEGEPLIYDFDLEGKAIFKRGGEIITLKELSDFYLYQSASYIRTAVDLVVKSFYQSYLNPDIEINEDSWFDKHDWLKIEE